jgi:glycosyltransferase involved in cell wall biosynthesis
MRLAFNATALLSPLTGIGQYSYQLALELQKQALAHDELAIDFFYGAFWDSSLRANSVNSLAKTLPWLRRHLPYSYQLRRWVQDYRFGQHVRRQRGHQKFDVYHEPNILPLHFEGPTVVTVHDLSWIRHPEAHPVERVKAMNRYFERGLRQASAIITDSHFVKQELLDVFGVSVDRVNAIPLGVEPMFTPHTAAQTQELLSRYNLNYRQYFLAVGTLEPRKNLALALKAYQRLSSSERQECPLVVIGMKGWHSAALEKQMEPLVRAGTVRQHGYVPRQELAALMAGAKALVYPSLYEGFGLPPLEAMACGTPVICTNVSSLPEVVGDAGIMVDPHDDTALLLALKCLIDDEAYGVELARKAVLRANLFSWAKCARQTRTVYESVAR